MGEVKQYSISIEIEPYVIEELKREAKEQRRSFRSLIAIKLTEYAKCMIERRDEDILYDE